MIMVGEFPKMDIKIFVNGSPFTSDEQTIDTVKEALLKDGWVYDEPYECYLPPQRFEPTPLSNESIGDRIFIKDSLMVSREKAQKIVDHCAFHIRKTHGNDYMENRIAYISIDRIDVFDSTGTSFNVIFHDKNLAKSAIRCSDIKLVKNSYDIGAMRFI